MYDMQKLYAYWFQEFANIFISNFKDFKFIKCYMPKYAKLYSIANRQIS